jgi:hypothetical protein
MYLVKRFPHWWRTERFWRVSPRRGDFTITENLLAWARWYRLSQNPPKALTPTRKMTPYGTKTAGAG